MRTNLKVFRIKQALTQEEIAGKIGYSRSSYSCIEKGKREGKVSFWKALQKTFNIPESEMFSLMENE